MAVHEELRELVRKQILSEMEREISDDKIKCADARYDQISRDLDAATDVLNRATIEQLWSLYKHYVVNPDKRPFRILQCNPDTDHLALQSCDMYIGIEPDGYMHS